MFSGAVFHKLHHFFPIDVLYCFKGISFENHVLSGTDTNKKYETDIL